MTSVEPDAAPHISSGGDAHPLTAEGLPRDEDRAPGAPSPAEAARAPKRWVPRQVLITPAAREWEHGRAIAERAAALGSDVVELPTNRLTGLRGADPRETYRLAKSTLGIVVAPPTKLKLQPIPPSADWRVDLAEGCPAHCQYCYLAGSLQGPPVTRVYANLPEILGVLPGYLGKLTLKRQHEGTTFEASCYTDPLGIEHLSGSLAQTIRAFGAWDADVGLRWTTKYDAVGPLLDLPHGGRTRVRFSVNAEPVAARYEGGTARVDERLGALRQLALAGYRVGLTVAPVMPVQCWLEAYDDLFVRAARAVAGVPGLDLTVECITHRFTPGSKEVLQGWYPRTRLEMDEASRSAKTNKFGGRKYVYRKPVMDELKAAVEQMVEAHLPQADMLYWT